MSGSKGAPKAPEWADYRTNHLVKAAQIIGFDEQGKGGRVCAIVDPNGSGSQEPFVPTVQEMLIKAEVGDWAVVFVDRGLRLIIGKASFEANYTKA